MRRSGRRRGHTGFTRRQLLRLAGLTGLARWLWPLLPRQARASTRGRFLTEAELATLGGAVARLIPADQDPGALELGAVDYIDGLLGAFLDHDAGRTRTPRVFAGGPFSGRHGGAPRFGRFLQLSRVQEIAWRIRIEGSRGLPEREFNGPVHGLQDVYRAGLADLDARARARGAASFAALRPADQDAVLRDADPTWVGLVYQHAVEACYAPPEYGGNRGLGGWRYIRFEGDRQPVGYSRYDPVLGRYVEFAAFPITRADPGGATASATGALTLLPTGAVPFGAAREAAARALRLARGA